MMRLGRRDWSCSFMRVPLTSIASKRVQSDRIWLMGCFGHLDPHPVRRAKVSHVWQEGTGGFPSSAMSTRATALIYYCLHRTLSLLVA